MGNNSARPDRTLTCGSIVLSARQTEREPVASFCGCARTRIDSMFQAVCYGAMHLARIGSATPSRCDVRRLFKTPVTPPYPPFLPEAVRRDRKNLSTPNRSCSKAIGE